MPNHRLVRTCSFSSAQSLYDGCTSGWPSLDHARNSSAGQTVLHCRQTKRQAVDLAQLPELRCADVAEQMVLSSTATLGCALFIALTLSGGSMPGRRKFLKNFAGASAGLCFVNCGLVRAFAGAQQPGATGKRRQIM